MNALGIHVLKKSSTLKKIGVSRQFKTVLNTVMDWNMVFYQLIVLDLSRVLAFGPWFNYLTTEDGAGAIKRWKLEAEENIYDKPDLVLLPTKAGVYILNILKFSSSIYI